MLHLSPFLTIYCCVLAALLGACMGSFLNCMAWRVVHGESVLRGRSHCDACGHVLGARDLVPVVSYLVSGGKCRYCGAKLSSRHVWGEVMGAAVFVSLLLHYDISLRLLEAWLCALPVSLLQEPVSARAAVFWRLLLPSGAIPVHGQMLCRNAGTWLPGVWSNPFCLLAEPSCHG